MAKPCVSPLRVGGTSASIRPCRSILRKPNPNGRWYSSPPRSMFLETGASQSSQRCRSASFSQMPRSGTSETERTSWSQHMMKKLFPLLSTLRGWSIRTWLFFSGTTSTFLNSASTESPPPTNRQHRPPSTGQQYFVLRSETLLHMPESSGSQETTKSVYQTTSSTTPAQRSDYVVETSQILGRSYLSPTSVAWRISVLNTIRAIRRTMFG